MSGLGARVGECEIHVFASGKRRKVCAKPKRKVTGAALTALKSRLKSAACAPKNRSKLPAGLKAWCKDNYVAPKKNS
jgi:hypothetical protein